MSYTRVNWQDSPSTATPVDAANLNVMDAGVAAAVPQDGSVAMSAALPVTVTLGGSNKVVLDLKATDGKEFQFIIETDGSLTLHNATDNVDVGKWGPSVSYMAVYDNGLGTVRRVRRFFGTTDPSTYLTPNEGDEWVDV